LAISVYPNNGRALIKGLDPPQAGSFGIKVSCLAVNMLFYAAGNIIGKTGCINVNSWRP